MNSQIQKVISLLLIIFITLLTFDYFKIIEFSSILRESLSFLTLSLILISSVSVITGKKAGMHKFINYVILTTTLFGGLLLIYQSKVNFLICICLLFTIVYAIVDMLYKKA
ncbi:hypothetical protein [Clostridium sp.]|mgnify:CR=1 FL=1|uniref:hypothetical protein n=1 Tax=Clostridium sp. TaxID=1506 RepID=UPI0026DB2F52|nr:hypothetical protein [Clostridium sp.]MDO5039489.1 hypothetical protein [Clostridium sp.]